MMLGVGLQNAAMCFSLKSLSMIHYFFESSKHHLPIDKRKGFDQISKNWCKIVRFFDDLRLFLNCTT